LLGVAAKKRKTTSPSEYKILNGVPDMLFCLISKCPPAEAVVSNPSIDINYILQ
jgi:hypothetical protein